jgi:hypothetical protein
MWTHPLGVEGSDEVSASGWPIGYWGTLGSTGHKNTSLSKCFRTALKDKLHYFYGKLQVGGTGGPRELAYCKSNGFSIQESPHLRKTWS